MTKMRVHEIAKELGVQSKVVIECLNGLGVLVTSHANAVSDEDAARVRTALEAGAGKATAAKKAPPKKAAAKKTAAKKTAAKTPAAQKPAAKKAAKKAPAKKAPAEKPAAKKAEAAKAEAKKPEPAKPAAPPKAPEAKKPAPDAAPPAAPEPKEQAAPPRVESAAAPKLPVDPAPEPEPEVLMIEDGMSVRSLAEAIGIKPVDIIRELMGKGIMATLNHSLDADVAVGIAAAHGVEARVLHQDEVLLGDIDEGRPEDLEPRAPIVTIMGHVDHGKTQLLDSIRQTNVVAGEAGGITQHIGASEAVWNGQRIVFIDTPGHEAFTRMRARGAQATDIVVLVVAANDGIMPQTVEAIAHARAAQVPIIVAINKIDLPQANVDRVKQQLIEHNLTPEDWGGDVVCVPVSAKTKENIEDLLEMILLSAELLELRANPKVPARGIVLEAELDRQRGPLATVLIQDGTVRVGDSLVAGAENAKVRAMIDSRGNPVTSAGPATAVSVLGFGGVPQAGDTVQQVEEAGVARKVAEIRQDQQRRKSLGGGTRLTLEDLHERIREGDRVKLSVVIKADAQGSVETLKDSLTKLSRDSVEVDVMHAGVGGVTENDVLLASASDAIIVGFNVRPERGVSEIAEREGVDLRLYTVIYQLIDEVKLAMVGRLAPTYEERSLGSAQVRDTFKIPRAGTIAGCYLTDGKMVRDAKVRLIRDSRIIYTGKVGSLRRFKEDVREVQQGYECGIGLENFNDVKVGDVIEAFEIKEIAATLT